MSLRPARGRSTPAELGADFPALASLRERPTEAPRDPAVFRYKQMARLSNVIGDLSKEIARLSEENARLRHAPPVRIMLRARRGARYLAILAGARLLAAAARTRRFFPIR